MEGHLCLPGNLLDDFTDEQGTLGSLALCSGDSGLGVTLGDLEALVETNGETCNSKTPSEP